MRIIITESQSKILWLRRRLYDRELMDLISKVYYTIKDANDEINNLIKKLN